MPRFTPNDKRINKRRISFDPEVALYEILRNWWVMLIGALIAAMISYMVTTETYKEEYSSTATFVVSTKGSTSATVLTNLSTAQRLAESFKYILDSEVLKDKVCEVVGIDSFDGRVTSELLPETNILSLTVTASSPKLAFAMINAIINNHHVVSDAVIGNALMDILMSPSLPLHPDTSLTRRNAMIKASLITVLLIAVGIVLMSAWNDIVKSEEDVAEYIDCDRLVTLLHEKRKFTTKSILKGRRKNLLVNNPMTSFSYAETFRLLSTRVEYLMKKYDDRILMIAGVNENEGRSTVAANLSIMLAHNNHRVLLIEGDMADPALEKLLGCDIAPADALNGYMLDPYSVDKLPKLNGMKNLSLLLCKTAIADPSEILASANMEALLRNASEYFDYIVIDTPPVSSSSDAEYIAEISDACLMVIRQNMSTVKRINDVLTSFEGSGIDVLGCVFNDVHHLALFNNTLYGSSNIGGYTHYGNYGYGRYPNSKYGYSGYETPAYIASEDDVEGGER